jgi:tetratricopeptide (TPR) repeat protein
VRPGTFAALQRHLEETERKRYPGYFHIVHFDVHGQVGLRKGVAAWAAFLYFASARDPDELAATRARLVGQLLRRHHVRVAVLNSCESARANRGDDANLAKIFAEEGVRNVLAMSFRFQSTTATLFLLKFYESLFAEGNPFSLAVADARESLRVNNTRTARFGIKTTVEDWIVPIVYVSGEDLQIQTPDGIPSEALAKSAVSEAITRKVSDGSQLIGRDFHVLRFEAMFLESRIVGLTGVAGVGKTAFLKHILSLWKESSFIDDFLYIDGAVYRTFPGDQIIMDAKLKMHQFLDASGENADHTDTSQAPDSTHSGQNPAGFGRRVIVIDHIESLLSVLPPESTMTKLRPEAQVFLLIESVMAKFFGSDLSRPVTLILVGRGNHSVWRETNLPALHSMSRFELGGLELSDAVNLAQNLLLDTQIDTTQWKSTDVDVLEQVVCLLQRNPLALKVLLSRQVLRDQPWKNFFEFLHFGQLTMLSEIDIYSSSGFVNELRSYGKRCWSSAIYSFLGLYWHQGPYNTQIYEFASRLVKGDKSARFVRLALNAGVKVGFFRLSGTKDTIDRSAKIDEPLAVDWIHPLFTVFMRASGTQELYQASFTKKQLATVDCLEWSSGSAHETRPLSEMALFSAQKFLESVALRLYKSFADPSGNFKFPESEESQIRPVLYNLISTMKLCTVEKYGVPFDDWLQIPWVLFGSSCLSNLWGPEALTISNHFEMLYRTFIRVNGGFIVEPTKQFFVLNVGNYLFLAHVLLSSNRQQEFVQLNMKIITSSEARHGPVNIEEANNEVAATYSNQAFVLLMSGREDEAEEMMGTAISIASRREERKNRNENFADSCQNPDHATTPLESHLGTRLSTSTSELVANDSEEAFEELDAASVIRMAWPRIKAAVQQGRGITSPSNTTETAESWSFMQKLLKARGRSMPSGPYWWRMDRKYSGLSKERSFSGMLSVLEDALDHGDEAFSALQHKELLKQAEEDVKFDEALQHCDAVIRIYEKNPGCSQELKVMREKKAWLEKAAKFTKSLLSCQVSVLAGEQDKGMSSLESLVECLREVPDLPEGPMESLLKCRDLLRSNVTNLVNAEVPREGSKKRDLKLERMEILARRTALYRQDPQKAMSDFKNCQQFQQHLLHFMAAKEAEDYEQALVHLDRFSELNDPEISMVSESLIAKRRRTFEGLRDWKAASQRVQQAVEAKDFEQGEAHLEEAVRLQASGKLYDINENHVTELRSAFESERWSYLVEQIYDAGDPADCGPRLVLIDDLGRLMSTGCFAHIDKSEREVQYVRLQILWVAASNEVRWKDAIDIAQQMMDLYENSNTPASPKMIAKARHMRWMSEIKSLHGEVISSLSTVQPELTLLLIEKTKRLLENPPPVPS